MSYFLAIDKEEQLALLLALFILEQLDPRPPKKIQVLRFIRARGLITFYDDDEILRDNGESKWMNDLSWAREDLKSRGFLSMPEVGVWKLTDSGRSWIVEKAKKWMEVSERDPASKVELLRRCRRLNECFFHHMIMLGKGQDLKKRPSMVPEPIPLSVKPPPAQELRLP
jgi:hypothetical protein